jgi:hypothetical protein
MELNILGYEENFPKVHCINGSTTKNGYKRCPGEYELKAGVWRCNACGQEISNKEHLNLERIDFT